MRGFTLPTFEMIWKPFLFLTAVVFFATQMTENYLQVDHIWLQVSETKTCKVVVPRSYADTTESS